jgi:hypothetical protein
MNVKHWEHITFDDIKETLEFTNREWKTRRILNAQKSYEARQLYANRSLKTKISEALQIFRAFLKGQRIQFFNPVELHIEYAKITGAIALGNCIFRNIHEFENSLQLENLTDIVIVKDTLYLLTNNLSSQWENWFAKSDENKKYKFETFQGWYQHAKEIFDTLQRINNKREYKISVEKKKFGRF